MKRFTILLLFSLSFILFGCDTTTKTTTKTTNNVTTSTITTTELNTKDNIDYENIKLSGFYSSKGKEFVNISSILNFSETKPSGAVVTIDDTVKYEEYYGVGAALTGASAYLIVNSPKEDEIIEYLFGEDGLNIQVLRLCIGASDFPNPKYGTHYSYDDMPKGQTDESLEHFTLEKDDDVIRVIHKALEINPNIRFIASPWSAPGWMKENDSLYGGTLKVKYHEVYADYLIKFIEEYAKLGIHIDSISLQNEPLHQTSGYPTMYLHYQHEREIIRKYLGPKLEEKGLSTKIMIYDHNADNNYPTLLLSDPLTKKYVSSMALHCYELDNHKQMLDYITEFKAKHPDIEVFMSECTAGTWYTDYNANMEWSLNRMYMKPYNLGAVGTTYWNIALDPKGETHNGGCEGCTGLISIKDTGDYYLEADGAVVGQYAKGVNLGSTRIGAKSSSSNIDVNAYMDEEGNYSVVMYNFSSSPITVVIAWNDRYTKVSMMGKTLYTINWKKTKKE